MSILSLEAWHRRRILLTLPTAATAVALAACGSAAASSPSSSGSSSSSPAAAAAANSLKTAKISGATVLTSAKGFTLYSFAPDTPTTSKCNGACAANWPPTTRPAISRRSVSRC